MALSPLGSHRASITIDLNDERFHDVVKAALDQQVQAIMTNLELAYSALGRFRPEAHAVRISSVIHYDIHPLILNDDELDSDTADPADEPSEDEREDGSEEEPSPLSLSLTERLVDSLPVVKVEDIEEESRDCPVCQEAFAGSDSNEADTPVMLQCSHIIGRACIQTWISGDHNTCPICRAAIFEPDVLMALLNQEDWEERSDIFGYPLTRAFSRRRGDPVEDAEAADDEGHIATYADDEAAVGEQEDYNMLIDEE